MTVFLIGGCPRSGTTLLQNILCSVSSTNPAIGEVGYLYHLAEAYHSSKVDFESQGRYFFKMSKYQSWLIKYIEKTPEFIQPDFSR